MKKILLVFGTRPEAIKMAPLVKEFQKYPDRFETKVCVTAQHREMLDQVLNLFEIKPDYDLNIMAPNQDLYDITSKVMLGIRDVLKDFKPDIVFVHGDTTTSMVTALSAFYFKTKVAHVEAGLRTYDLQSPWPEEMNRQLTDRISDYYFAPTEESKQNLLNESVPEDKIFVTGNTVIDALLLVSNKIDTDTKIVSKIKEELSLEGYKSSKPYILVTGHRRENFGDGFLNICKAIKTIALNNPEIDIIYPVHLNPNVQKPVYDLLLNISNVYLMKPLDYLPFVYLMKNSYIILTDSGGVQEEAPSLGKPVLVMRNTTERPEAIKSGTVKLVGTNSDTIVESVTKLLLSQLEYNKMSQANNPYGNGKACELIVNKLL